MLNNTLILSPVLALPNLTGHLTRYTDACRVQVGCVFQQEHPGNTVKPLRYCSRSLTYAAPLYDATRRDCLDIVCTVIILLPSFETTGFPIRTDHESLMWMLNFTDSTKRLARWRLGLSEYAFDAVHRTTIEQQAAGALSRLQITIKVRAPLEDDFPILATDVNENEEGMRIIDANCNEM